MIFWKDSFTNIEHSYSSLLIDVNATGAIGSIIKETDPYTFFKKLIIALTNNIDVVLLDGDLSEEEEIALVGHEPLRSTSFINNRIISNPAELKDSILASTASLTLFTSGTTGRPKKVKQAAVNFLRSVKASDKFAKNVWGFAYNPSHMAGLQVFFQGVVNLNPFIYIFRQTKSNIIFQIEDNAITNISATPTFLRGLLPADFILTSVKRITTGGEKFDAGLVEGLQPCFPEAAFRNIYASTESGSLFTAQGNIFSVPENIAALVKIEDGILFIHHSLVGEGDFSFKGDWYVTGDVVDVIHETPLQFIFSHRNSELINVGGYKVNPHEIEDALVRYSHVRNAKVFGKKNALLGNTVIAEVEMDKDKFSEISIKNFLANSLQEYKIPVFIKRVDKINITHTGKIERIQ